MSDISKWDLANGLRAFKKCAIVISIHNLKIPKKTEEIRHVFSLVKEKYYKNNCPLCKKPYPNKPNSDNINSDWFDCLFAISYPKETDMMLGCYDCLQAITAKDLKNIGL